MREATILRDLNHFTSLCYKKKHAVDIHTVKQKLKVKHHLNGMNISICLTVETNTHKKCADMFSSFHAGISETLPISCS